MNKNLEQIAQIIEALQDNGLHISITHGKFHNSVFMYETSQFMEMFPEHKEHAIHFADGHTTVFMTATLCGFPVETNCEPEEYKAITGKEPPHAEEE